MKSTACNKQGCTNTGCNRLSRNLGLICDECFNELVKHPQNMEIFMMSEKDKKEERPPQKWIDSVWSEFRLIEREV